MNEAQIQQLATRLSKRLGVTDAGVGVEELRQYLTNDTATLAKVLGAALTLCRPGSATQAVVGLAYSEENLKLDPQNTSAAAWKDRWEHNLNQLMQSAGFVR